MIDFSCDFNYVRNRALDALTRTLDNSIGESNITERKFHNIWQEELSKDDRVLGDGWYAPPPQGMAVLSGGVGYPSRVSFESLRKEEFWPSNRIIDWRSDLLYAYCSPVDAKTGIPGDVAVTLYFGQCQEIRKHFKNTFRATQRVLALLDRVEESSDLFHLSNTIFQEQDLQNCVFSITDQTPLDLGHTLPKVTFDEGPRRKILTSQEKERIRRSRQFINAETSWGFINEMQFTIEPQLISTVDKELPQVAYHYLVQFNGKFKVCNDVETLLKRYDLL